MAQENVASVHSINHKMHRLTIEWKATGTGTFVDAVIPHRIDGRILCVDTNPGPGAVAPQDDYDIYLKNDDGIDVMGGALTNRDTANSERALPLLGTTAHEAVVEGCLTLSISGNNVADAIGTIKIYFLRDTGN
jgi:hypothetical protein